MIDPVKKSIANDSVTIYNGSEAINYRGDDDNQTAREKPIPQ